MYSYIAYGLGIHSELPLPELVEAKARTDVLVRLGKVDRRRPEKAVAGVYFWATPEECCVDDERVGGFLVRRGQEVTVDPAPGVSDGILRSFLLGPILAVLLYQRGRLTLHASAVAINGGAVAFLGGPGWGKSTTAAALQARGHSIVADDVVVIESSSTGSTVLPGFPQFKLWPDAAAALGDDPETLPRLHPEFEKRARQVSDRFSYTSLPLRRVYLLAEGAIQRIEPLRPQEALVELVRHSLGTRLLAAGGRSRHFLQCADLVRQVPIHRLERPRSLAGLQDLARLVEEDVVGTSS